MLLFTIFMIVLWLVGIFLIEVSRVVNKKYKEIEEKLEKIEPTEDGLQAETTGEKLGQAFMLMGVGCSSVIVSLTYLVAEFIYLMYALQVDPYLYPTYIMLTIYIGSFIIGILKMVSSKVTKKKNELPESTPLWSYFIRVVTAVYFAYMLWAIIN